MKAAGQEDALFQRWAGCYANALNVRQELGVSSVRLSVLPLLLSLLSGQAADRPNILFIFSDDHALQAISAYGGRFKEIAPTPNIDRLGKQGAVFERSYCANSICGPSRACILTGKHSHINGFIDNDNSKFNGAQPTFPKYLQQAGYQTAMIGKWPRARMPALASSASSNQR